jgi:peroxiredoxin (alkyl hydroperoxide reductase subunit C)
LYDIYCRTGIKVPFPIIADRNGTIARKYGMISNDVSNTETVRNVFIIDDKGIVRAILVYPMNVGRCIPEILRLLQALQIADCNKGATPANWCPYEPMIVPMPQTYGCLEERIGNIEKNRNGFNWYLSFKQPEECCNRSIEEPKVKEIETKQEIK